MKIKKILPPLLTLLLGMLLGWLFFGGSETETHQHVTEQGLVYTCSMHPHIRSGEPGACPLCGMALTPLEATAAEAAPLAVGMSDEARALANVQTMVVGAGAVVASGSNTVQLSGKIVADERQAFTQTAHISGRLERLLVNFTGEYVRAGQVLGYLYSPELVTAQQELQQAKRLANVQPALLEAAKQKLRNFKLSEQQVTQLLSATEPVTQFPVRANRSGYVVEKLATAGDHLMEGSPIFRMADLSQLWVQFDVYEQQLPVVQVGSEVNYSVEALPGKSFSGRISYIDPAIDAATQVAKARLEVRNPQQQLKPGMLVRGKLATAPVATDAAVVVPKSAVMWTGKRSIVYVKAESAAGVAFQLREVELGAETAAGYEILSGLQAGEEIAVNGTFSIDAAAQLAGKPSMMNMPRQTISPADKQQLQPLFGSYFSLEQALAADDFHSC